MFEEMLAELNTQIRSMILVVETDKRPELSSTGQAIKDFE